MPLKIYVPEPPPQVPLDPEQAELEKLRISAEKLRKEAGLLPVEMESLQSHLDQELKKIEQDQPLPPLEGSSAKAESQEDPETKEFIQLADFITKERQKQTVDHVPEQQVKLRRISLYKAVKDKEFELRQHQKGVQVDKSA